MFSYYLYLYADCIFKTEVFFLSSCSVFKSGAQKTLLANISQGTNCVPGARTACAVKMVR